jgi:hypothetical protein
VDSERGLEFIDALTKFETQSSPMQPSLMMKAAMTRLERFLAPVDPRPTAHPRYL